MAYEIDGRQYFKKTIDGLTSAGTNITSQRLAMDMVRGLTNVDDEYVSLKFNFLCNDFGDLICKNGTYLLGGLFRKK